jgi:hypothetical protein
MRKFSQTCSCEINHKSGLIDIEGCDKHQIEAVVKSFNLICLKTNIRKIFISRSFKIILKFEFLKNLPF